MPAHKVSDVNPLYLWQFLRRNEFYRHAVDEYKKNMTREELRLFDSLKDTESMRKLIMGSDYYEDDLELEPSPESLNYMSVANTFGGLEFLVGEVDFNSATYKNFYRAFGDMLTFPLDYDVETPCTWAFRSVWNLDPVRVSLLKHHGNFIPAELLKDNNKHRLSVSLDFRFSKKQIMDAVEVVYNAAISGEINLGDTEGKIAVSSFSVIETLLKETLMTTRYTYEQLLPRLKYYDYRQEKCTQDKAYELSGLELKSAGVDLKSTLKDIDDKIKAIIRAFNPPSQY